MVMQPQGQDDNNCSYGATWHNDSHHNRNTMVQQL
jgi:hypothetical protein